MTSFREQLIASALQGLLANNGGPLQHCASSGFAFTNCTVADVAKLAVELADAVLHEDKTTVHNNCMNLTRELSAEYNGRFDAERVRRAMVKASHNA